MRKHFYIACTILVLQSASWGQIIHYDPVDIPIPETGFDGVYIDIETLEISTSKPVNWDINFAVGGFFIQTNPDFAPIRSTNVTIDGLGDPITNLDIGATIDSNNQYYSVLDKLGGSTTHWGPETDQFQTGSPGLIGFKFKTNDTGQTRFGWMRVTITNATSGGLIHEWAWNDSGGPIEAGLIPEPSTYALIVGLICVAVAVVRKRLTPMEEQK